MNKLMMLAGNLDTANREEAFVLFWLLLVKFFWAMAILAALTTALLVVSVLALTGFLKALHNERSWTDCFLASVKITLHVISRIANR